MTDHDCHYRYIDLGFPPDQVCCLERFTAIKETPCGCWVLPAQGAAFVLASGSLPDWAKRSRRFVLKTSRKKYCYPTKEEAWEAYRIRKARALGYAKARLEAAQGAYDFSLTATPDAVGDYAAMTPSSPISGYWRIPYDE
jgi:hypothetical protein